MYCFYSSSAHLLYSTLLEACGAIAQAREVLCNLLLERSCGHGDLESHLARIHFERRNGTTEECLKLFDSSIERFRRKDGRSACEIDTTVYFFICERADFLCDVHNVRPEEAMEFLYEVMKSERNAFSKDEFFLIVEKAYHIICRYSSPEQRDQEVSRVGSAITAIVLNTSNRLQNYYALRYLETI